MQNETDSNVFVSTLEDQVVDEGGPKAVGAISDVPLPLFSHTPKRASSPVWKIFGLREIEKGQLDTTKAYCNLCGEKISYAGSTSNLKYHLKAKHVQSYVNLFPAAENEDELDEENRMKRSKRRLRTEELIEEEIRRLKEEPKQKGFCQRDAMMIIQRLATNGKIGPEEKQKYVKFVVLEPEGILAILEVFGHNDDEVIELLRNTYR